MFDVNKCSTQQEFLLTTTILFEQYSSPCSMFLPTQAITLLPACPFLTYVTSGISRHPHPEGEPCIVYQCTFSLVTGWVIITYLVPGSLSLPIGFLILESPIESDPHKKGPFFF